MSQPVLFVIGGTGKVGTALAQGFSKAGYRIALASRSAQTGPREDGALLVKLDLTKPTTVATAFHEVKQHFGVSPSVVVYNAYANLRGTNPLEHSVEAFTDALATNATSLYAALKAAVEQRNNQDERLVFIDTGNYGNTRYFLKTAGDQRVTAISTLAIGKTAAASTLETAAPYLSKQNVGVYFADERDPNGDARWQGVDAQAHADFYLELVRRPASAPGPVIQTFIAGKGYVEFEHDWQN